jgi:DNA-binding transcriptional ArsR family regulator
VNGAGSSPPDRIAEVPAGPSADALVGLLAEPVRLRVVAALALGATTTETIEAAAGLEGRQVRAALDRLVRGGLVATAPGGGLRLAEECFSAAARASSHAARSAKVSVEDLGVSGEEAKALRPFFDDGRLTGIPAPRSKRLKLLNFLAGRFEPGRVYPERDVNAVLGQFYSDVASLRRYLVDEQFLERRQGFYWRAGGTFDVD